jgi:hypothetical protein
MPHQSQEISKSILENFAIMALSTTLQSRTLFIVRCLRYFIDHSVCVACVRVQGRRWEEGGRQFVLSSWAIETKGRQNEQKN